MSEYDVYRDEMPNTSFSDQDVERFLSGHAPENVVLAGLAPILKTLHSEWGEPPKERVEIFAAQVARAARAAKPESSIEEAKPSSQRRRPLVALQHKLATGLATILALTGMTGVAVASNGSAPGDALYGIDRALEAIGLGAGGSAERIAEAQAVFEDGFISEAIAHAAEAVPTGDGEDAWTPELRDSVEALRAAAASVSATNVGEADEIRAKVGEMLSWMADNAPDSESLDGEGFGQEVAGFARSISGRADDNASPSEDIGSTADGTARDTEADEDSAEAPPGDHGPPEGIPGGQPDGIPGPPDRTPGPPDRTPGPPDRTPGRP